MDFEGIAMAHALGDIAGQRNRAHQSFLAADRETQIANGEIRKANAEIFRQRDEIAGLKRDLAAMRSALALEQCITAGLDAMVDALLAEVRDRVPDSKLRALTGRTYENGHSQRAIHAVHDKAFDTKARAIGLANPEKLRERLK